LDNHGVVTETRPIEGAGVDDVELTSIFSGRLRTTSGGLITLITMIAFEAMAVGPALPTAARDLHGLGAFGWAFTSFLVANVLGMVVAGQISDAHGPRRPMIAGIGLFIAGLAIAGTSTTMAQLVLARGVQGLGGGLLITSAYVLIGETYPSHLQPKVFIATSGSWLVPSLVGPVISGTLTQHASWRWVFLGLLPFVAIGSLLMVPVLRGLHHVGGKRGALADPRRILRAVVVALGVAAFEAAGQHPSALAIGLAVLGFAAVGWGLLGLVPPGTLVARPGVASAVALRGLFAGAFFGADAVIPLMLQQQHHLGATAAGLPLAVSGLTWALGSWWQGRDVPCDDDARRVRLLFAGFSCAAIGIALIAITSLPAAPAWLAYPAWATAGIGAGLAMTTSSVLLLKRTTDANRGRDSAALQLSDTTSAALTTGLAGVLVAAAARGTISYTAGFLVLDAVLLGVVGIGFAAVVRARTVRE
jgi:MFS family permease